MKKSFALVACALLVASLAACNADKGPADAAIKAADQAITAAAPEAEKFILEQLTPIPGIEKIRSSFALKQVRYKTALPLPHARS